LRHDHQRQPPKSPHDAQAIYIPVTPSFRTAAATLSTASPGRCTATRSLTPNPRRFVDSFTRRQTLLFRDPDLDYFIHLGLLANQAFLCIALDRKPQSVARIALLGNQTATKRVMGFHQDVGEHLATNDSNPSDYHPMGQPRSTGISSFALNLTSYESQSLNNAFKFDFGSQHHNASQAPFSAVPPLPGVPMDFVPDVRRKHDSTQGTSQMNYPFGSTQGFGLQDSSGVPGISGVQQGDSTLHRTAVLHPASFGKVAGLRDDDNCTWSWTAGSTAMGTALVSFTFARPGGSHNG